MESMIKKGQSFLRQTFNKRKPNDAQKSTNGFSITKVKAKKDIKFGKVIAICVDAVSIQMAATLHRGNSLKVLDIAKEYFPVKDFSAEQREQLVLNNINDFLKVNGRFVSEVVLVLPGPETVFRTFLMPYLKDKELAHAVHYEVDKQIPFSIENCSYDFRKIYKIVNQNQAKYKVTLHATTKQEITNQLKPLEQLGITISSIVHAQDNIGQLLEYLPEYNEDQHFTLLNIGRNTTEISFYRGMTLEFSHSTTINTSILWNQGDTTKYEFFAESIANEIQNSLDYYAGQYSSGYNNNIYVYGDFAYSDEILKLINEKGGINLNQFPIEHLSFLTKEQLSMPEIFPSCLPVLAASTSNITLANLLPIKDKQKHKEQKINSYLKAMVIILFIAVGNSWMYYNNASNQQADTLNDLSRRIEQFQTSEAFHSYNLIKREISRDRTYLENIKEIPSYLHLNLKELSLLTPKEIQLQHYNFDSFEEKENLYLQGVVRSQSIPPEVILAEFVEDLKFSPYYDNVEILRHIKKNVEGKFQIEFQLKMRGVV